MPPRRSTPPLALATAALAVAAAWCASPPGALAADQLFAGSFCQPASPADGVRYGSSGVYNVTAGTVQVECPFWLPYSSALTVRGVDVTVYDRNPTQDVACTVSAVDSAGHTLASVAVQSSGSSIFAAQSRTAVLNRPVAGTLSMSCSLPPAVAAPFLAVSAIATYRLRTTP